MCYYALFGGSTRGFPDDGQVPLPANGRRAAQDGVPPTSVGLTGRQASDDRTPRRSPNLWIGLQGEAMPFFPDGRGCAAVRVESGMPSQSMVVKRMRRCFAGTDIDEIGGLQGIERTVNPILGLFYRLQNPMRKRIADTSER